MNQSSQNSGYFHIPLPGDEPQAKAGFYATPPSREVKASPQISYPPSNAAMEVTPTPSAPPPYQSALSVSNPIVPNKKNTLLAYLVLLFPFFGPALSFLILGRKTRAIVNGAVFLLYFILGSFPEEFVSLKGILGLYITVEFFILLFKIPKLSRTDPIPGKYWS